jgi:hypothetical protein
MYAKFGIAHCATNDSVDFHGDREVSPLGTERKISVHIRSAHSQQHLLRGVPLPATTKCQPDLAPRGACRIELSKPLRHFV